MEIEKTSIKKYFLQPFTFILITLFLIVSTTTYLPADNERNDIIDGPRAIQWLVNNHYLTSGTHVPTQQFIDFVKSSHSESSTGPGGLLAIAAMQGWAVGKPLRSATIVVKDARQAYDISGYWIAEGYFIKGKQVIYKVTQSKHSNIFTWRIVSHNIKEWVNNSFTGGNKISCTYHRPPQPNIPDTTDRKGTPLNGDITLVRGNRATEIIWTNGKKWTRPTSSISAGTSNTNISGKWKAINYVPNNKKITYSIKQSNNTFNWTVNHPDIKNERIRNAIIQGNRISCDFNRPYGPDANGRMWTPISGTIESINNRAVKIIWDNGVVWIRE